MKLNASKKRSLVEAKNKFKSSSINRVGIILRQQKAA
jgi:hypothetical protein